MSSKFTGTTIGITSRGSTGLPVKPRIDISAVEVELRGDRMALAVAKAAAIGLAALRTQVNSIGRVTGNLANSVMLRVARSVGPFKAFAEVGFAHEGGQHAHLVEYGTEPRTTKSKGIFSSAKKRGKWKGMGTYPQNFISGREYVRGMPALYPLQKAMNKSSSQMSQVLYAEMNRVGNAAIEAGMKELKVS